MTKTYFETPAVFYHASRTLDVLRRMDFMLVSMMVATECSGLAELRVDYEPRGSPSADTWFKGIRNMSGVFDYCDTNAEDSEAQHAREG